MMEPSQQKQSTQNQSPNHQTRHKQIERNPTEQTRQQPNQRTDQREKKHKPRAINQQILIHTKRQNRKKRQQIPKLLQHHFIPINNA
jgi:hypothetical protein